MSRLPGRPRVVFDCNTRDKDLLSLMTGHSPICKQFRQTTHPLQVLDPGSFLEALGQLRDAT